MSRLIKFESIEGLKNQFDAIWFENFKPNYDSIYEFVKLLGLNVIGAQNDQKRDQKRIYEEIIKQLNNIDSYQDNKDAKALLKKIIANYTRELSLV